MQSFEKALTLALDRGHKIVRGKEPDTILVLNADEQEKLKEFAAREKEAEAAEAMRQEQIAALKTRLEAPRLQASKLKPEIDWAKGDARENAQSRLQAAEVQRERAEALLELATLENDGIEIEKTKRVLINAKTAHTRAINAFKQVGAGLGQPESSTVEADTAAEQGTVAEQNGSLDGDFPSETTLSEPNETVVPEPVGIEEPAFTSPPLMEVKEVPTPKEIAEGLTAKWEKLGKGAMEEERSNLAEGMHALLDPLQTPSEAAKVLTDFFNLCETEPETPHPLFWILAAQSGQMQRRQLIARLDLSTLAKYAEWLIKRPPVPVPQVEVLLEGLTGKFQDATREGGINHYQRIAQAMGHLLKDLDPETCRPYEWRLFSFLRESWARLAPHAQAGNNDLIGAQNYLTWVLDRKQSWPETIWDALLSSLMRDEAINRLEAGLRRRVLECAATHALAAPKGQRLTRLLHFQEALTEQMLIEFMIEIGKEATR